MRHVVENIRSAVLACLFLFSVTACAGANPTLELVSDAQNARLTAVFTEADVEAIVRSYALASNPVWLINPVVDLQNGAITLRGEVRQSDGQIVPAEGTAQFSAQTGWLSITVTSFTYGGYTSTSADLERINRAVASDVASASTGGQLRVDEVTITDDELRLGITVPNTGGVSAQVRLQSDEQAYTLSVFLTTSEIRALITPVFGVGGSAWLLNPAVSLQQGGLVISGNLVDRNTGSTTPASMTLDVGARNGLLRLSVSSLVLGGWEVPESILGGVNREIQAGLTRAANTSSLRFEALDITPEGASITMRIPRQ
jgi:hypothetical protein